MFDLLSLKENKKLLADYSIIIRRKTMITKYLKSKYNVFHSSNLEILNILLGLLILILFNYSYIESYTFLFVILSIGILNSVFLNLNDSLFKLSRITMYFNYLTLIIIKLTVVQVAFSMDLSNFSPLIKHLEIMITVFLIYVVDDCFVVQVITNLPSLILSILNYMWLEDNLNMVINDIYWKSMLYRVIHYLLFLNGYCYFVSKKDKLTFCLLSKYFGLAKKYEELLNNNRFALFCFKNDILMSSNKFSLEIVKQFEELDDAETEIFLEQRDLEEPYEKSEDPSFCENVIKRHVYQHWKVFNPKLSEVLTKIIEEMKTGKDINSIDYNVNTINNYVKQNKEDFKEFTCVAFKDEVDLNLKDNFGLVYLRFNQSNGEVETAIHNINHFRKINLNTDNKCLPLAKITHEFKNPLMTIIELIESGLNKNVSSSISNDCINENKSKINNNIKLIQDLGKYMLILIKDIDYISSNTDKNTKNLELNKQSINISEIFNFCISISQSRIKSMNKNIIIKTDIASNNQETIFNDDLRLKQIIVNLLSNSIKFTIYGTITLKSEDFDENYIKITVLDTGIGIKEDNLAMLTNPYYKVTQKNNLYGAGLGLSIVKDFVSMIGKDLNISSIHGKGTTISFLASKNNNELETQALRKQTSPASTASTINKNLFINFNKKNKNFQDLILNCDQSMDNKEVDLQNNINIVKKKDSNKILKKVLKTLDEQDNEEENCFFETALNRNGKSMLKMKYSDFNIMIVDDELILRTSLENQIKKFFSEKNKNVEIILCEDGAECIGQLFSCLKNGININAIVTDQNMQLINGNILAEVVSKLKTVGRVNDIMLVSNSSGSCLNFSNSSLNNLFALNFSKPPNKKQLEAFYEGLN